jgi:hypothetical protein
VCSIVAANMVLLANLYNERGAGDETVDALPYIGVLAHGYIGMCTAGLVLGPDAAQYAPDAAFATPSA